MRLQELYSHNKESSDIFSLLVGGPGAGKTSALNEYKSTVKDVDLVFTATTNAAAQALGGKTVHSFLGIPFQYMEQDPELVVQKIGLHLLRYYMNECNNNILIIVIDEAFILDAYLLNIIKEAFLHTNEKLKQRNNSCNTNPNTNPIKLVLCGDPAQLQAIQGERFYHSSLFTKDIPVFRLEGVFRQSKDIPLSDIWVQGVNLYRTKGDPSGIITWITQCYHGNKYKALSSTLDFTPSHDTFTIAFTNETVEGINLEILRNHCISKGINRLLIHKSKESTLYLAEGVPVIFKNGDKDKGITKRQRGVVTSITNIIPSGADKSIKQKIVITVGGNKVNSKAISQIASNKVEYTHEEGVNDVPVTLGYAGTIHTSQGSTYKRIQVLVDDRLSSIPGALLVSLTRHISDIRLVGVTLNNFKRLLEQGVDMQALQYV